MSERLAEMVRNLPRDKFQPDEYNEAIGGYCLGCRDAADLIANSPELAEMKRDAERYRWLRDSSTPAAEGCMKMTSDGMSELLFGDELDAAIDAAQLGEKRA